MNVEWERDSKDMHVWEGRDASQLTAIVVERGEVGLLLRTAGTVAHPRLQLVPRGFLQLVQDVRLGERGPLSCGPDRGPEGSVLQCEGGDGTAAIIPADEVQPHARGVDAGEEFLLLRELGLCGRMHGGDQLTGYTKASCQRCHTFPLGCLPHLGKELSLSLGHRPVPICPVFTGTWGPTGCLQPQP